MRILCLFLLLLGACAIPAYTVSPQDPNQVTMEHPAGQPPTLYKIRYETTDPAGRSRTEIIMSFELEEGDKKEFFRVCPGSFSILEKKAVEE